MRNLIRIGFALLLIGVGISITFAIVNGQDIVELYNHQVYEYHELDYEKDEFSSLTINVDNKEVIILPSTDEMIHVKYYDSDKIWIDVTQTEEELRIESDMEWYGAFTIGFNFDFVSEYHTFYLYLPNDVAYDLFVDTSNGRVSASDLTLFGRLVLNSSNGGINLTNVTAEEYIKCDTSNGKLDLDTVNSPVIELESSNGGVYADKLTTDKLDVYTSNGRIEVEVYGVFEDYRVKLKTSNGDVFINNEEYIAREYHTDKVPFIDLNTSNGDITLKFID